MNTQELMERLKQLQNEELIWLIYIGIIIISWYANQLERKYFIYNDIQSKENYRKMLILIFSILIVIYIYFLRDSFNELKNIKPCDSNKKRFLTFLSLMGSLLIAISGIIFLYIAIMDESIEVELAFN